jgi:hypothetical protein
MTEMRARKVCASVATRGRRIETEAAPIRYVAELRWLGCRFKRCLGPLTAC